MKKILLILLVLIFSDSMLAQNTAPNDCVNAIELCGNGVFQSNTSGFGKQEISACGGFEHNSLWIKINIVQAGNLGFDLIPNDTDISTDFDFWVYGPNKPCPTTADSPIRCATTNPAAAGLKSNHTGINGSTLATTAGPGANGTGYVQWLPVKAGETYYIAIDRPYSTVSGDTGFQLNWTGTANAGTGAFPSPPVVNKISDDIRCSTVVLFNLTSYNSQINSDPNNTITYYASLANAVDGTSPLPSLVPVNAGQSKQIYAKVMNNAAGTAKGCYTITDFALKVFSQPTANIVLAPSAVCSGGNVKVTFTGTPGATVDYTVNGGSVQSVLLDSTGTFVISDVVTSNRTYAVVKAKILDATGKELCPTDYTQDPTRTVTVKVNPLPTISGSLTVCLNGTSQLTGSGNPATTTTPWTSSDTTIATVSSTGLVTGIALGTSTITYTDSNLCSSNSTVTVTALPTVSGKSSICISGSTQLTGSGTPAASNPWVSSDPSIATVTSSGLVSGVAVGSCTITYTDVNGCSGTFSLDVTPTNNTQSATAEVSNYFAENQTITVTVIGDASYLYSLDGGPIQTSNVFTNVPPGIHYVSIGDTQGCTDLTINDIVTIGFPHFFTPNNDGYNDTWNITSFAEIQPDAEIFIFDRYAKLLKRITPSGAGWDGTYNGQPMPSSDYWFTVSYNEKGVQKLFRSHFTLKR